MGHNEHKEAEITINAPGVIVAGMLMLTSFIIIPYLFSTSPSEGFAFQRRGEIFFILSLPPPFHREIMQSSRFQWIFTN